MNTRKQALIIAGGLGTRLRPVTYEIPKSLLPIHNRPILEYMIENLRDSGIRRLYMYTDNMGGRIVRHYGDGSRLGVSIEYIGHREDLPPAGNGAWMREVDPDDFVDDFVVTEGDILFDGNFRALLGAHRRGGALLTIPMVRSYAIDGYGVITLDGSRITSIVSGNTLLAEDPEIEARARADEAPFWICTGTYLMSRGIFEHVPDINPLSVSLDVVPAALAAGGLFGAKCDEQWFDTGTMERWETAIREWRGGPHRLHCLDRARQ